MREAKEAVDWRAYRAWNDFKYFCYSAATASRDENLEARALAAAEMSTEERKQRTVVSLTFPPPPYHCPRCQRAVGFLPQICRMLALEIWPDIFSRRPIDFPI
jgi:hypothetical protein